MNKEKKLREAFLPHKFLDVKPIDYSPFKQEIEEAIFSKLADVYSVPKENVARLKGLFSQTFYSAQETDSFDSGVRFVQGGYMHGLVQAGGLKEFTIHNKELAELVIQNRNAIKAGKVIQETINDLCAMANSVHHILSSVPEAAYFTNQKPPSNKSKFRLLTLPNPEAFREAVLFYRTNRHLFS